MFEKTTRMNFLIDIYESLLTEKQKSYVSLYYLEDLSLGEIAEEFEVSRQAVYDNIKRTEAVLENYETKLGVLQKYQEREHLIEQIEQHLTQNKQLDDGVAALLQQLKNMD
ncbi:putative DNA-binding protein [Listeria booriae]|uniref:putative DNA-binding protein n=1 Tax=Listeria booriae TaxID=1552123 RepID=UPI00162AAFFC|nr:putative DNA-binding protein [Listeria booriae]MBC2366988.1 putative DNA-binding protein [Listeria booriae]